MSDNPYIDIERARAAGGAPTGDVGDNPYVEIERQAAEKRANTGLVDRLASAFGATQRGAADVLTFGLAPRIRAAAGAAIDAAQGDGFDYAGRLEQERAREGEDRRRLPYARVAGQLLGGVALPAGFGVPGGLAPAGAGLGELAARGAAAGMIQGGAQAAGSSEDLTNLPDVAKNAKTGALVGGAIGGAFPLAAARLGAAARGLRNGAQLAFSPEDVAARQVGEALSSDAATAARRAADDLPSAPARALSSDEFNAARDAGAPVVLGDRGAEATRSLARNASNLSDEAGNILSGTLEPRFEGQSRRIAEKAEALTPIAGATTGDTLEALQDAARQANKVNYDRYFAETAGGVISPGLEEVAAAPAVRSAMREAARKSANQAAASGAKPEALPIAVGEDGSVSLTGAPSGKFWDHVKQALDDRIGAARRQGEMSEARDLGALRNKIVGEVDALAPSYGDARGVAQRYFNGMDALEAGADFATGKGSTDAMLKGLFAMRPEERKLFGHAYAGQLKADVLKAPDRRDMLNRLLESEDKRTRLKAAIGFDGFNEMQAFRNVEDAMDKLRRAVAGNSTTVKQGLRAKVFENGGVQAVGAALVGSHIGGFAGGVILPLLTGAMRKFVGAQRAQVATEVAKMLVSEDPQTYARAIAAVAKDQALTEFFKRAAGFGAKAVIPIAAEGAGR